MNAAIDYPAILQDLQAKLSALDEERALLVKAIEGFKPLVRGSGKPQIIRFRAAEEEGIRKVAQSGSSFSIPPGVFPKPDEFVGMGMTKAIQLLFERTRAEFTPNDVKGLLASGGYKSSGDATKLYASVFSTLKRMADSDIIKKSNDGKWSLVNKSDA